MNADSCECSKSELDLFTVPPTNISMEKGSMIECVCHGSVSDNNFIEFDFSSDEEYIDLGRTFLYIKAKVTKKDKSNIDADAKVGPINLWMHSLFSQVDVQIGTKLVSPSINTYPYKAYLETLLSYGNDAKESQLSSELWYTDQSPFSAINPKEDGLKNEGFARRAKFISESSSVEMMGRLHCDIFQQDRYLLNKTELKVKLIRSPETFHLMADGTAYSTIIEDAALWVRTVKLNPRISTQHTKTLSEGSNAKYPLRRGVVTSFTIPKGHMNINKSNVTMGQLPRRVIVGLVSNKAFNGSVDANPYEFKHYSISHMALQADGQQYPNTPLQPNFDEDKYIRSYMTLFEGTGMLNDNKGHGIKRTAYKDGFALYAFDLTPDMTDGAHVDLIKHGSLRMNLQFTKELPETVNVIVYAEYDNILQIDRARNVIVDF